MVKKLAEENIYERSKVYPKQWTVLRFIFKLLTLNAKHSWSDGSFNGLVRILAWLLPNQPILERETHFQERTTASPVPKNTIYRGG
jgi:hypothetical protein